MKGSNTGILAGDIGGTKTHLAVFSQADELASPVFEETFPSRDFASLEELAHEFLTRAKVKVTSASFCVAGPVVQGTARITNLPWVIDSAELSRKLNLPKVGLYNDLVAFAQAVPLLKQEDLHTLNEGERAGDAPIMVIAPGTGLGEAFLVWDGNRYRAQASEGGHTDFAPTDPLQMGLLQYLSRQYDHVSYERVCSGIGLPNIYAYLKESGVETESEWVARELAVSRHPAAVITTAAQNRTTPCPLCRETLAMFISILGAAAGNGALQMMTFGGVYLGGGIPPRILTELSEGAFMQAFAHKGRFSALMSRIPVHVILNPKTALLGAASLAII